MKHGLKDDGFLTSKQLKDKFKIPGTDIHAVLESMYQNNVTVKIPIGVNVTQSVKAVERNPYLHNTAYGLNPLAEKAFQEHYEKMIQDGKLTRMTSAQRKVAAMIKADKRAETIRLRSIENAVITQNQKHGKTI